MTLKKQKVFKKLQKLNNDLQQFKFKIVDLLILCKRKIKKSKLIYELQQLKNKRNYVNCQENIMIGNKKICKYQFESSI